CPSFFFFQAEDCIRDFHVTGVQTCALPISRDITFPTVQDQEWYDDNDHPDIRTLVRIVAAYSEDAQGQRTTMVRVPPEEIETLRSEERRVGQACSCQNARVTHIQVRGQDRQ